MDRHKTFRVLAPFAEQLLAKFKVGQFYSRADLCVNGQRCATYNALLTFLRRGYITRHVKGKNRVFYRLRAGFQMPTREERPQPPDFNLVPWLRSVMHGEPPGERGRTHYLSTIEEEAELHV